jgi:hypothetical protein
MLKKTVLGLCLFALAGSAFSADESSKSKLYVGSHAQVRHTNFDKKFGRSIMRKVHNQGHIFLGFKLTDNFAIELGRESMIAKPKNTILAEGKMFNGIPISKELAPSMFNTKMSLKALNLDLVYYKQIFDGIPLSFVPSLGISHITINVTRDNLHCGNFSGKIPSRIFNKSFLALKPGAALQYDFEGGFSLRTSAAFVNTSGTRLHTTDSHTFKLRSKPRVNLKDSCVFGIGFTQSI